MSTREKLLSAFLEAKSVSTDSRSIQAGAIFFALKGDNFNGNIYAQKAIESGASLAVVDEEQSSLNSHQYILVEDVLNALQNLASDYRSLSHAKIIGLTGSNGKTTCKELFRDVLATRYKTYATKGNLNNHIGVPLTLLSIPLDAEVAIIEMGANHQGEIALLTEICRPDIGYITNFGKAHLEGFGGIDGVIKGKSELYNWLREHHKSALVNGDEELHIEKSEGINRTLFGTGKNCDIQVKNLKSEQASAEIDGLTIHSQLTGNFHFVNIAATIALGKLLNVELEKIKVAIESYNPQMNRSEWRKTARNEVLMDAYNANPDSMIATIETFAGLNKPNKWFVLGDMFELGKYAHEEHQNTVEMLVKLKASNVILVGNEFCKTKPTKDFKVFKSTTEAHEYLQNIQLSSSTVLLKGSRGMKLETLIGAL